jgi:hypothetical protein
MEDAKYAAMVSTLRRPRQALQAHVKTTRQPRRDFVSGCNYIVYIAPEPNLNTHTILP